MDGIKLKGRIGHINKKLKLLLYCTKLKGVLRDYRGKAIFNKFVISPNDRPFTSDDTQPILNGKIVAECDFEVEEMEHYIHYEPEVDIGLGVLPSFKCDAYRTNTLGHFEILKRSCLDEPEILKYLGTKSGYAIHIKNLHIFDKPKELKEYKRKDEFMGGKQVFWETIKKAPQNMMYAYDNDGNKYIVISIQPQWMCLILNRIKDVEVRRVVLKEMLD